MVHGITNPNKMNQLDVLRELCPSEIVKDKYGNPNCPACGGELRVKQLVWTCIDCGETCD